jgi:hypothetical protein
MKIRKLAMSLIVLATTISMSPSFAGENVGLAGGGNCSVWASIKSAIFGVHCSYYM